MQFIITPKTAFKSPPCKHHALLCEGHGDTEIGPFIRDLTIEQLFLLQH